MGILLLIMEDNDFDIDYDENLEKRVPMNYSMITEKQPAVSIEKILKHDDDIELVLFELPKGFDKTQLDNFKLKNFGSNGKISKLTSGYKGISFDKAHSITQQSLSVFMRKDGKSLHFKPMDRYVKVFESIDN